MDGTMTTKRMLLDAVMVNSYIKINRGKGNISSPVALYDSPDKIELKEEILGNVKKKGRPRRERKEEEVFINDRTNEKK
jgi:hypothetical protein